MSKWLVVAALSVGCGPLANRPDGDAGTDASTEAGDAMDAMDAMDAKAAVDAADVVTVEVFGGACSSDADCATGLLCWNQALATANGAMSWPAHGVCTAKCESDASCDARSKGSACVSVSGGAMHLCLAGCDSLAGADATRLDLGADPEKCGGRPDLACFPAGARSYCMPTCNDDAACAPSRCGANGFCTDKDVGDWADIGKDPAGCSTHSVTSTGSASWCTARCTLGVVPSCGWAGPGTRANAVCVGELVTKVGDSSFCYETCDCDSDCRATGVLCTPFDEATAKDTGRKGICSAGGAGIPSCAP